MRPSYFFAGSFNRSAILFKSLASQIAPTFTLRCSSVRICSGSHFFISSSFVCASEY